MGFLFLTPLRRIWESPQKVLGPWIEPGQTVVELGPAMGYFSLDLARMVAPNSKVICSEIQPRMREVLQQRVERAGLSERMDIRSAQPDDPNLDDLQESVDFAFLHNVLHEVADPGRVLGKVCKSIKAGGLLFLAEPAGHVSRELFAWEGGLVCETGLVPVARPESWRQMNTVFRTP